MKRAPSDPERGAKGKEVVSKTPKLAPQFLAFDPVVEKTHPFTIPHILAQTFGFLNAKALLNVRLVSKSTIWQKKATTVLLARGCIRKPASWPTSGPMEPLRNSRTLYTAALDQLLSKSPLSEPLITVLVADVSDINLYRESPTLLSRVRTLIYGGGHELDIKELGRILQDLPNLKELHLKSPFSLQYPPYVEVLAKVISPSEFHDPNNLYPELPRLTTNLLGKIKSLVKFSLEYSLPAEQLKALVQPSVVDNFAALSRLDVRDEDWGEYKVVLRDFLQADPPWRQIETVKFHFCHNEKLDDFAVVRQLLLHLGESKEFQNLNMSFWMTPGLNQHPDDTRRLGFDTKNASRSDWLRDDWLLPQDLNGLKVLHLELTNLGRLGEQRRFLGESMEQEPQYVPPEFVRTLVTGLRLQSLQTLELVTMNLTKEAPCSLAQMVQLAQDMGPPCPTLEKLVVHLVGDTSDCPFFPAHLWPNLKQLKIQINCMEFHGVQLLRSIWPQYTQLERLSLSFNVHRSMSLGLTHLSEVLWGRHDTTGISVNEKESIVNLKNLKTLTISSKVPSHYAMTDFSIYNGLIHMQNLQKLTIRQHQFTATAITFLRSCLSPTICCKIYAQDTRMRGLRTPLSIL